MIEEIIKQLKIDKDLYYAWQANIAVAMQDEYSMAKDKNDIHKISNEGAKRFLDLLIRD